MIAQKLGKASQRKLISWNSVTQEKEQSKLQKKSKKDILTEEAAFKNEIDPSWYDYLKNDNFPRWLGEDCGEMKEDVRMEVARRRLCIYRISE